MRNPRTAVCTLSNTTALLVTVDGRYPGKDGMTLPRLSVFLKELGCRDAINLDGGGSTSMYIAGMAPDNNNVVNEPRDKPPPGVGGFLNYTTLRSVSNSVMIW